MLKIINNLDTKLTEMMLTEVIENFDDGNMTQMTKLTVMSVSFCIAVLLC
jgi:hypothetical protein